MRVAILLIAAGCGRLGFDAGVRGDGAVDGPGDGPGEGGGPCVWGPWSAPTRLPAPVSSPFDDWSPNVFLGDTLMMFHRYANGGFGGDLFLATRGSPDEDFAAVGEVTELNTTDDEWTPGLSGDGLVIVYAANTGTGFNLRGASRTLITDPFGPSTLLASVNTATDDYYPVLDATGHAMMFASNRPPGERLYETTRPAIGMPFAAPELVELGGEALDPALSTDRLEVFFTSTRPGGQGLLDVWTARRPSTDQPFDAPVPVAALNSSRDDCGPELSADGTTIFFNRDTLTAGGGQADIWSATRACE